MSENKQPAEKDKVPNMELLLIFIFFFAFIVWTVSKCFVTQERYEQEANKNNPSISDTLAVKIDSMAPVEAAPPPKSLLPKDNNAAKEVTALYVVLDGLKLRKGPTRKSAIIQEFKLHDRVYFLDEVTEFREQINLGDRMANEPWVKVRAKSGYEGWVYGAGVHYHRQQFLEPSEEE